jgi:glycosyltransferase involved in cell wall biosynthesis
LLQTTDFEKANLTFWFDVSGKGDHFLYREMGHKIVQIEAGSEASSFLQLLDYVEKQNFSPETILYFVEDDYIHKNGWVDILMEGLAMPGIDYVTLYDHKDKYFFPMYKNLQSKIYLSASSHWRTVPSTTQTFAMKWKTLKRDLPFHRLFSKGRKISDDHKKFSLLTSLGRTLVSPIPGWSTHAEPEFASPLFDWNQLLNEMNECV